MSQQAWALVTLALGVLMVVAAAIHDKGRPRLAPLVWLLAVLTLASMFAVGYAQ